MEKPERYYLKVPSDIHGSPWRFFTVAMYYFNRSGFRLTPQVSYEIVITKVENESGVEPCKKG